MAQLYIRKREGKRGATFQASFETAPVAGKRTRTVVGTFKTKKEAQEAGMRALAEYNAGNNIKETLDIYAHWTKNQQDTYYAVLENMFTERKKDDTDEASSF